MATRYEYYSDTQTVEQACQLNWGFAQGFTPAISHSIKSVKLPVKRDSASAANITVSIRNTSGGLPTGSDLVSVTVALSTIPQTLTLTEFVFPTAIQVNAGTTYAIVLMNSAASPNVIYWSEEEMHPAYSGGVNSVWNGSTWGAPGYDFLFEEWGEPLGGLFFCMG